MNVNDMFPSKYLSQKDVPQPQVYTIQGFIQENVTDKGVPVKKNMLILAGAKPWILNKGNASRLAALFGSSTDSWMGRQIEVYTDPLVEMGGRVVGGLRLRAPAQQPAPSANGTPSVLWDYSYPVADGKRAAKGKQAAEQVVDFLAEFVDAGGDPATVNVRLAGSNHPPVTADKWQAQHAPTATAPIDDPIPF